MHRFELGAWNRQTDRQTGRQTEGRIAASLNAGPRAGHVSQQRRYTLRCDSVANTASGL